MDAVIVIVGVAFTFTVIVPVSLQPAKLVPTTLYVVVTGGLTFVESQVLHCNPLFGNQVYPGAPPAIILILSPEHISGAGGASVTVGVILTVIAALSFVLQPPVPTPVTVYVVETDGVATTLSPNVTFNPVGGDQEYDPTPPVLSITLLPLQIVAAVIFIVITGTGYTTIAWVAVAEHPDPFLPVSV